MLPSMELAMKLVVLSLDSCQIILASKHQLKHQKLISSINILVLLHEEMQLLSR